MNTTPASSQPACPSHLPYFLTSPSALPSRLQLTPQFAKDVSELPFSDESDCDHKAYLKFIDTWGLHVVTSITTGGLMGHTAICDQVDEMMTRTKGWEDKMNIYGEYGTIKGNASAGIGKKTEQQFIDMLSSCVRTSFTYGGDATYIGTDDGVTKWIKSVVDGQTIPLYIDLTPIVDLLEYKFIAPHVDMTLQHLQNVHETLTRWNKVTYCEYLRATKVIDIYSCVANFDEGKGMAKPKLYINPTVEIFQPKAPGRQFPNVGSLDPSTVFPEKAKLLYRNTTMPPIAEFSASGSVTFGAGAPPKAMVRLCVNASTMVVCIEVARRSGQGPHIFDALPTELPYMSIEFIGMEHESQTLSYSLWSSRNSSEKTCTREGCTVHSPLANVTWTVNIQQRPSAFLPMLIDQRILIDPTGALIIPPYNVKFSGFVSFSSSLEHLALAGNCEMMLYIDTSKLEANQDDHDIYTGSFGKPEFYLSRSKGSRWARCSLGLTKKEGGRYFFVAFVAVPTLPNTIPGSLRSGTSVYSATPYAQVLSYTTKFKFKSVDDEGSVTQTACADYCPLTSLRDDNCVQACNITECFFDGGACLPPPLPPRVKPLVGPCKATGTLCSNNTECASSLCSGGYCCPTACKDCRSGGICYACDDHFYLTKQTHCMPLQNSGGPCSDDNECRSSLMCGTSKTCVVAPMIVVQAGETKLGPSEAGAAITLRVSKLGREALLKGKADSTGAVTWDTSVSVSLVMKTLPLRFTVGLWRTADDKLLQNIHFLLTPDGKEMQFVASWSKLGEKATLAPPGPTRPLFVQFSAHLNGDSQELETTATPTQMTTAPSLWTTTSTTTTTTPKSTAVPFTTTAPITSATPQVVCRLVLEESSQEASCLQPGCEVNCLRKLDGTLIGSEFDFFTTSTSTQTCFCPRGVTNMSSTSATDPIHIIWSNTTAENGPGKPAFLTAAPNTVVMKYGTCKLVYSVISGEILGVSVSAASSKKATKTWVVAAAASGGALLLAAVIVVILRRRKAERWAPKYQPVSQLDSLADHE